VVRKLSEWVWPSGSFRFLYGSQSQVYWTAIHFHIRLFTDLSDVGNVGRSIYIFLFIASGGLTGGGAADPYWLN